MSKAVVFEARREGYGIDQVRNPVTVGELIAALQELEDEDAIFILSHDGGYTYGSIARCGELQEDGEIIDDVPIW